VLRVGKDPHDTLEDSKGIALTEMLARHGLKPTLEHRQPAGDAIAEVLNKVAFEKGADLIVTGAFGHSKTYDFVVGATTHSLLHDAKLPVLISK
jgi:nucleotide-binding universal stress UspA family protein